jgi:glycosyltransferase involved in cell wall biosynthesis
MVLKVAIAHDYITQRGGAEKVVLAMARAFPDAPIYTLLYNPETTFPEFANLDIRVSPLNRVGVFRRNHRAALPLLAVAASRFPIDADIVITSSSGWAHAFPTMGTKIVYCYTPARWLYQADAYLGSDPSILKRMVLTAVAPRLRQWDKKSAKTAQQYIAISTVVRERIRDTYGLDSDVVPAPYAVDVTMPKTAIPGLRPGFNTDFSLCVSRLLPYKNVDKVIEAFRGKPDRQLIVVGSGPENTRLRSTLPSNVVMMSGLSDAELRWLYSRCSNLVAASYEDFGLTPIEAAAFGKPSAVLRFGGYLDTVIEGVTGEFFAEPTPAAISDALDRVEARRWDAAEIAHHVERFEENRFAQRLHDHVTGQQIAAVVRCLICALTGSPSRSSPASDSPGHGWEFCSRRRPGPRHPRSTFRRTRAGEASNLSPRRYMPARAWPRMPSSQPVMRCLRERSVTFGCARVAQSWPIRSSPCP